MLCNSTLLRCGWCSPLSEDARGCCQCIKLLGSVFTSLVVSQCPNGLASLVLHQCLVLPECVQCLVLGFHEVDAHKMQFVVNECDLVFESPRHRHLQRVMNVRVYKLKDL